MEWELDNNVDPINIKASVKAGNIRFYLENGCTIIGGVMEYLYLDFAIHSPIAFELAKWMDDIKNRERIKASKLFKLIFKYEKRYKRPKRGYNEPPHPGLNAYMRPPKPRQK